MSCHYGGVWGLGAVFGAGHWYAKMDGLPTDGYESRRDIVYGSWAAEEQKRQ